MKHISSTTVFLVALGSMVHGACVTDDDRCEFAAQCDDVATGGAAGPGGSTTTNGGGATSAGGAGGTGGTGGGPTCTEDPLLCEGNTPVCHEGACVPCTPDDDALCAGETPYCNPDTNACQACSYHAQCPESACNVFTGACLDATPQTVGPGGDHATLTLALASVADGAEAVFLVSPEAGAYQGANIISGTRVIALLGQNGRPVANDLSLPTFTVANGATLLLEGIDLKGNTASRGIQADGLVAVDRVEISSNNGGIAASGTAELLVRNSIVAANANDVDAIALGNGTLEVLYSAVGGEFNSAAFSCTNGHQLTVRNSILFNRDASPTLDACTAATITHSAGDETLAGTDNTTFTVDTSLFEGLNTGNLRLTAAGKTAFAGVALWQLGDPAEDIDGTARPTADQSPDVAGAHLGP